MATMTRVDSGSTVTYVITDAAGSTLTAVVTVSELVGNLVTFTSSGGLHLDGLSVLWNSLLPGLATGLLPNQLIPVY